MLDQFWSNYAKHKNNNEYLSNSIANLDERVSVGDALIISHYALNVGLVSVDSVYAEAKDDSVDINIAIGDDQKLTQKQVCELVDKTIVYVKSSFNQTNGEEGKAINRLELGTVFVQGTIAIIRVKWSISFGKLYSIANMMAGPNVNKNYFGAAIPWLSQETFGGTRAQFLSSINEAKYFAQVLLGVISNPTRTEAEQTWDRLPVGKAAHHRLSNRNIFWPDPLRQLAGWYPIYSKYTKPVKSPTNYIQNGVLIKDVNISGFSSADPLRQIIATDVPDCSNPLAPGLGITPNYAHMTPSKLLGWYGFESSFGLTAVRKVPVNAMNYFWSKKADLIIEGRRRGQSDINKIMTELGNNGYFALTDFEIKTNHTLDGNCNNSLNCGTLCLHSADYKNWLTFAHYTTQKKTPIELQLYF